MPQLTLWYPCGPFPREAFQSQPPLQCMAWGTLARRSPHPLDDMGAHGPLGANPASSGRWGAGQDPHPSAPHGDQEADGNLLIPRTARSKRRSPPTTACAVRRSVCLSTVDGAYPDTTLGRASPAGTEGFSRGVHTRRRVPTVHEPSITRQGPMRVPTRTGQVEEEETFSPWTRPPGNPRKRAAVHQLSLIARRGPVNSGLRHTWPGARSAGR